MMESIKIRLLNTVSLFIARNVFSFFAITNTTLPYNACMHLGLLVGIF